MIRRTPFRQRGDQLGLVVYVMQTEVMPLIEVEAGARGTTLALTPRQAEWLIVALSDALEETKKQQEER